MSDLDHFKHYKAFLNPSLADRFDYDAAADFLPELSLPGKLLALGRQWSERFWFLHGWPLSLRHRTDPLAAFDLSRHHQR